MEVVLSNLAQAEVCLRCQECGRPLRARLQDLRRRRTIRCPAGHRTELGMSHEWRRPPPFDQDALDQPA
ncbi:MAG: hypothetical protein ACRDXD_01650 [Acidimicrobiia bacterium]